MTQQNETIVMGVESLCRIRDLYRAIAELEAEFVRRYTLSLNEGMLLCTLLHTVRMTAGELAKALGLSASNTSKIIRTVERKGYVKRFVGKEDKRQMYFSLTPEGRRCIEVLKVEMGGLPPLLQRVLDSMSGWSEQKLFPE